VVCRQRIKFKRGAVRDDKAPRVAVIGAAAEIGQDKVCDNAVFAFRAEGQEDFFLPKFLQALCA